MNICSCIWIASLIKGQVEINSSNNFSHNMCEKKMNAKLPFLHVLHNFWYILPLKRH